MTGDELRKLREAKGLTQSKLGGLLGVPGNTVSRWELGERPISRVVELAIRFACGHYVPGQGIALAAPPGGPAVTPADAAGRQARGRRLGRGRRVRPEHPQEH